MEHLLAFFDWLRARPAAWRWGMAIAAAAIALPLLFFNFAPAILVWTAPRINLSQDLYAVNRPVAFTFLDANGAVAGHRGAVVGERLRLEDMPPYVPAAFIAMEDRRFYEHDGIDMRGLARAMWTNLRAGHVVAGGSTITQQTAKIVFLSPQRTFTRKYEELLDAAALEKSLTKKQILELYLNRIYLGSGAYGVDGAAHVYFGKSARNLTLPEAAMLATLTRAPSVFSPRRDLAAAQVRASLVLTAMTETGAITKAQADTARANAAVISNRTRSEARNFFLDTAADEALRLTGMNGETGASDLIVHTTLQPRLQEAARRAVSRTLGAHGRRAHAGEAAVILMDTGGAVAAMTGGRDYDASEFDRATQAKRQPGSAFKPFVYLAGLEKGLTPWDERDGSAVDIDGWTPTNYGGRTYGTVTLATALAHSINTVTAALAQEVGIGAVIEAAHRCGIVSTLARNASLALGTSEVTPLELTTAYAAFASGGLRVQPYFVTQVEDSAHRVLYTRTPTQPERVIATHVDRDLTEMLYGVIEEGTGRGAALPGREAAGKTGTTQDYHDAWFVGFTTDYVAGVWVGNDDSSPMHNVTGGTLPADIWKDVMVAAEQGLPAKPLAKSSPPAPEEEASDDSGDSSDTASSEDAGDTSRMDNARADEDDDESSSPSSRDGDDGKSPHSFLDWLFGKGTKTDAQSPPPPGNPPPPPPPSSDDPDATPPPPPGGDNGN